MIILDEDLPQKDSTCGNVAGPTLRLPERAATRSISPLTLPDYETSQALANHNGVYKKYVRRRIDSRCVDLRQIYGCSVAHRLPLIKGSGGRPFTPSSYTYFCPWSL